MAGAQACTRTATLQKQTHTKKTLNLKEGRGLLGFDVARGDLEEKGGNKREDGGEQDPAYFH